MLEDLDKADNESNLLLQADSDEHIVRYFGTEKCSQFVYIAIQLCDANLKECVDDALIWDETVEGGTRPVLAPRARLRGVPARTRGARREVSARAEKRVPKVSSWASVG